MDFHGWNFTGTGSFGAPQARMNVVPGTRIAERLGTQVAVSSQPIVVNAREGGVREAIRTYVREAPRAIERAAGPDSERLAPVLARDRTLPADTLAALRERVVVAERGRLTGPAAAEIAPRASASAVERSRALPPVSAGRAPVAAERWRTSERGPVAGADQSLARIVPRAGASETWRARGNASSAEAREVGPRERAAAPERQSEIPRTDRAEGRPPVVSHESWRSRPDLPPARRVIEGAVPERRAPERRMESSPHGRDTRSESIPRERIERAPVALPPPARVERPPVPAAPPPHVDRAPSNSAPPAPAPRSEVRHESPPQRSAPAPQAERGRPPN
jgi:hypothetical protein